LTGLGLIGFDYAAIGTVSNVASRLCGNRAFSMAFVISNFHAFKLRERVELSKGGRQLLQGRVGEELDT
jgi:hypothetical protein